jgi:hypothetical protein
MKHRKIAIIVGILFIIATTFFVIGQLSYESIITPENVLDNAYPERMTIFVGVLFEFLAIFSIILIPVFLYPILKKYNESLSLAYAGFRFLGSRQLNID